MNHCSIQERRCRSVAYWLTPLTAVVFGASCRAPAGVAPTAAEWQPSARQMAFLDTLQRRTFDFFWERTNPRNGLTPDRWPSKSFSSIAAVGFALAAYPIGVERGYITRSQARDRTLATLKFFWRAPHDSTESGVAGYRGFYYHFLDMETGYRFERVELSTIDTTLLLGGVLACQMYFSGMDPAEIAIRAYADSIYHRVDWRWAQARPPRVSMGWHPATGFIKADWSGYNEAMLLYVLALGTPTFALDSTAWQTWASTYQWGRFQGQDHVGFAPLFGHQYSHMFIDFRGISDSYMKAKGIDYFENSRRATFSQRSYAIANPDAWRGYGANSWGLTASDGPADDSLVIDGRMRRFTEYAARGVSFNEVRDDGTIAPTALGGSIPFAPEITIPTLVSMREKHGDALFGRYGFLDAYNETYPGDRRPGMGRTVPGRGWYDTDYLGIDQGPILIMVENYRTGLIWNLLRKHPAIIRGLKRAGFTGSWLDQAAPSQ